MHVEVTLSPDRWRLAEELIKEDKFYKEILHQTFFEAVRSIEIQDTPSFSLEWQNKTWAILEGTMLSTLRITYINLYGNLILGKLRDEDIRFLISFGNKSHLIVRTGHAPHLYDQLVRHRESIKNSLKEAATEIVKECLVSLDSLT